MRGKGFRNWRVRRGRGDGERNGTRGVALAVQGVFPFRAVGNPGRGGKSSICMEEPAAGRELLRKPAKCSGRNPLERNPLVDLPGVRERDTVEALFRGGELHVPHGRPGAGLGTKNPCWCTAWTGRLAPSWVLHARVQTGLGNASAVPGRCIPVCRRRGGRESGNGPPKRHRKEIVPFLCSNLSRKEYGIPVSR